MFYLLSGFVEREFCYRYVLTGAIHIFVIVVEFYELVDLYYVVRSKRLSAESIELIFPLSFVEVRIQGDKQSQLLTIQTSE